MLADGQTGMKIVILAREGGSGVETGGSGGSMYRGPELLLGAD